jgi:transcriptional regulator with XRE-family HTH domain
VCCQYDVNFIDKRIDNLIFSAIIKNFKGEGMRKSNKLNIGKNIRSLRIRAGLTINDLATRIGVTHSCLLGLENRAMPAAIKRLDQIANELGVGLLDIIDVEKSSIKESNDSLFFAKWSILKKLSKKDAKLLLMIAEKIALNSKK